MRDAADRILQESLSGGQGPRRRPASVEFARGIRPAPPRLDVYLALDLDAPSRREGRERVAELRPGETYRLTLRAGAKPEGQAPPWLLRGDEIAFAVSCPEAPELAIECEAEEAPEGLEPSAVALAREQVESGVELDFRVVVPEGCPRRLAFLEVSCFRPGTTYRDVCLRQPVDVLGEELPLRAEDRSLWNLDPSSDVPAHVAFLYVQEPQPGQLALRGWHRRRDFQGDEGLAKPELSLASFIDERQPSRDIVARMRSFSGQRIPRLLGWLRELLGRPGERLLLVVVDPTGAEVPWEMLSLQNVYLGAEAEVVRWASFWEFDQPVGLRCEEEERSGCTAGFLDPEAAGSIVAEGEELDRLAAERLGSPGEVLERLARGTEGLGLLYVACHGAFAYAESEARRYQTLFSQATATAGRRFVNLDLELLERPDARVPVVIVNACHSGRLLGDGSGVFGLPAVFLRKVADSYIGTLGAVANAQAAEIGTSVLRAFREAEGGARPSEILRRLRQEAAAALDPQRLEPQSWRRFLFTFMYVYYGNPLLRLNLHQTGGVPAGAGDEETP